MHPRTRAGLAGAVLGLLALVPGCGATPPRAPGGPPSVAAPSGGPSSAAAKGDPDVLGMPVPTADLAPVRLLSAAEAKGYDSVGWSLDGQPHGTDLVAVVPLGGCRRLVGARVDLTARAVAVAVLATRPGSDLCVAVGRTAVVLIRLPEPIGARRVVRAPTTG